MIPANGAPHDLEARDVHRSLPFAQRRARDDGNQIGASPNCRPSTTFTRSISMSAASRSPFATNLLAERLNVAFPSANAAVAVLVDLDILRPQGKQRRNRAFQAHEVMNLLHTGIDAVLNDVATLQNYGYARK